MLAPTEMKNYGKTLNMDEKNGGAALSGSQLAILSTYRDVTNFYNTGKGLYLGKFV